MQNPETETDRKKCPYCAEEIRKAAIFCRYCKKDLPDEATDRLIECAKCGKEISELRARKRNGLCNKCAANLRTTQGAVGFIGMLKIASKSAKQDIRRNASKPRSVVCPHCGSAGKVTLKDVKVKKGISGGKATAGLFTGGLSLLATGLSQKHKIKKAECSNCGSIWHYE